MRRDAAEIIAFMEQQIPFNRWLKLRCERLGDGVATLRLPFREEFVGDPHRPALHGGVLSTLIDTCGGAAAFTVVSPGQVISTVDLLVDYLRPGPLVDLLAFGEVVRKGSRVCVARVRVQTVDAPDDPPIATGRAVYNIVGPRRP